MVLGVAGKYCAGKDTAVAALKKAGFDEINMDHLGHLALKAKSGEVLAAFGRAVGTEDGSIDRKKLGEVVFSDERKRLKLETIVHPWMREETTRRLKESPKEHQVLNAALLFYMGLDELCDGIIWVTAPLCLRLKRAKQRDSLGTMEALKRIWAQRRLRLQKSGHSVDIYKVVNRGARETLEEELAALLKARGL